MKTRLSTLKRIAAVVCAALMPLCLGGCVFNAPQNDDAIIIEGQGNVKPDEPDEPDQPDEPGQPEQPDQPNQPEQPDESDEPDEPNEPGQPDQPDQPDEPGQPDQPDEPGQPDQPDEPDQPDQPEQTQYTAGAMSRGMQAFYSIVEQAASLTGNRLSATQKNKINSAIRDRIIPVFERRGIAEVDFLDMVAILEEGEGDIAQLLAAIIEDSWPSKEEWGLAEGYFGKLSALFGVEESSSILFDLTDEYLDYRLAEYEERYEQYKYEWYLDYIEDYRARIALLHGGIGRENYLILVRIAFSSGGVVADLLADPSAFWTEVGAQFTDAEFCTFLGAQADLLGSLTLDGTSWQQLSGWLAESDGNTLNQKLYNAALKSGDISAAAEYMPRICSLLSSVLGSITPSDVSALRGQNYEQFLRAVFGRFEGDDWALLDEVFSTEYHSEQYDEVIEKLDLSEDYAQFLADRQVVSLEELKLAAEEGDVVAALKGYLVGKVPHLVYAWSKS